MVLRFADATPPADVQVIETPLTVTITVVQGPRRLRRRAIGEVFVPLSRPLAGRRLIDGGRTTELRSARPA